VRIGAISFTRSIISIVRNGTGRNISFFFFGLVLFI
jgi:hypothetical protein